MYFDYKQDFPIEEPKSKYSKNLVKSGHAENPFARSHVTCKIFLPILKKLVNSQSGHAEKPFAGHVTCKGFFSMTTL